MKDNQVMTKKRFGILMLVCGSCGLPLVCGSCDLPLPQNSVVAAPPNVAEAIELCRDLYSSYKIDVSELPMFKGAVVWLAGECLDYEDVSWIDDQRGDWSSCRSGRYYDDTQTLWLLIKDGVISHTALGHELIHYWLDVTVGDIDADHERDEWWPLEYVCDRLIEERLESP